MIFKVKEVTVTILNADGTEVEHGKAEAGAGNMEWVLLQKLQMQHWRVIKSLSVRRIYPGISAKKQNYN